MQQSGGLLLAAGWTAATQEFSFPARMKMQTNLSISANKKTTLRGGFLIGGDGERI